VDFFPLSVLGGSRGYFRSSLFGGWGGRLEAGGVGVDLGSGRGSFLFLGFLWGMCGGVWWWPVLWCFGGRVVWGCGPVGGGVVWCEGLGCV